MHKNCEVIFHERCADAIPRFARVLEIGPEAFPSLSQRIVAESGKPTQCWHTADKQDLSPEQTYVADLERANEIPTGGYDVVFSTQVLEHVYRPWRFFHEMGRICKIGGLCITISPWNWPYHEVPVDCWRIAPEGMRVLYEDAGFDVLDCRMEALAGDDVYDTWAVGRRTLA